VELPVTIGFWPDICGEGCTRPPFSGMVVERSPVEPLSS